MKLVNFVFDVEGNDYEDLISKIENKISDLVLKPVEELHKVTNYEVEITESGSKEKHMYKAKVTARIKNV